STLMDPMLDEFRVVVEGLSFEAPRIPIATSGDVTSPEYWVNHFRDTVRFADSLGTLSDSGVSTFLELGPDGVLTAMAAESLPPEAVVVPVLRKDRSEELSAVTALARLHVNGVKVNWSAFFVGLGARRVDLPTYAFQRQRFWPSGGAPVGDVGAAGLQATDHPLLGAVVWSPDNGGAVFTGRLSIGSQPWLADHVVLGSTLLPGTGFVELALRAGDEIGCGTLEELTLAAPLVLPEHGGVQLQVVVSAADERGRRPLGVYSRSEEVTEQIWMRHAAGFLTSTTVDSSFDLAQWPPADAESIAVDGAYDVLRDGGFEYGPVFQGLRTAWKRGDELFAEVALPEGTEAGRFGLHPALLDAAMHVAIIQGSGKDTVIPFVWNDVSLHAVGASAVRVRLTRVEHGMALAVADVTGRPVLSVGSMAGRPVSVEQLVAGATSRDPLFGIEWKPIAVSETAGELARWDDLPAEVPDVVVLECVTPSGEVPGAVRSLTRQVLAVVQEWLADERFAGSRLAVVTRNAVAVADGAGVDVVQAPVWGLVRSAQAENPGRFVLVDVDEQAEGLLAAAVASDEPEVAIHAGEVFLPRLVRLPHVDSEVAFDPEGAVLITGGTGGLGAVVAKYLVAERGVRHLVLTSRRGLDAPGAAELVAELDAQVDVVACDVSDRDAVAALIGGLERPLTGVVHAAGVGDNGLIGALTPEQFDAVLAPKADAAWYLHELTREMDLAAFVLFSSAGGLVLAAGQANYAAANVFLDGLAAQRQAEGLTATSMAFALWDVGAGLGQYLTEVDRKRMANQGLSALSYEAGLAMFADGLDSGRATVVPVKVDTRALRARTDTVPALLRGLVPPTRRAVAAGGVLDQRLGGMTAGERLRAVLQIVRGEVASVLGHASAEAIEPARAFQELGFDSLAAIELRNRLNTITGLSLPATLVFDHPNAQAVSDYIDELVGGTKAVVSVREVSRPLDDEPIAIVGMACRYPGGVSSPEDLWRLVAEGVDTVGDLPVNRGWNIEDLYDPEPGKEGKSYTRRGSFLHDAADFDPEFFGISPREALFMDPHQRLLLESSWEAMERSGIDPVSLRGSKTGVFAGVMYHDYALNVSPSGTAGGSVVSGRLSYTFGWEGPAV
ncbi:MAG: 3-ketoacyl-ACP reductase, partial [Amycolatopsis sp.]|uniref:type I polyketide synthase n=1 Tax=Amycolatopsis sp. TaxID=37632 RepID=UPI00261A299E